MIIDFHTHCFPDDLAEKTIPVLAANANITASLDGTLNCLKESMKRTGVTRSVVLPIATKPTQTEKINSWAAGIQDEEIIAFGSIHPEYEFWKEEIHKIKDYGLKGIKLHPEYQNFYVDEERMFPIYEAAFEQGLIVLFHAGLDVGLPPPYHCTPERLKNVIRVLRGGIFVAAHMGGFAYWDEVEKHLVGEDIYFDTSYSLGRIGETQMKRIIEQHGYEKILFATDSPWTEQKEEIEKLKKLNLGKEAEDAIFYKNAFHIL